jgi:hypothetical protein
MNAEELRVAREELRWLEEETANSGTPAEPFGVSMAPHENGS